MPVALRNQNHILSSDSAAHEWYRFVLSFPPHLVRDYLDKLGADKNSRVLDPFCGTGTTIVECKILGISSIGIEANPMAWFASRVKTDWSPSPERLLRHAEKVADQTLAKFESDGITDENFFPRSSKKSLTLLTLPPERLKLLLKDSISPLPLHKTLTLLRTLEASHSEKYSGHEKLALSKALVDSIGNLHFGPEVGVRNIKKDAPVINAWLKQVGRIVSDLRLLAKLDGAPAAVIHADSRDIGRVLDHRSIDIVITSPPYPNEKDYTRTTRLEAVMLGFINDRSQLRSLKAGLIRSNTRNVFVKDKDDTFIQNNRKILAIADAIEKRRLELNKNSGFERLYPRVAKLYFGGMKKHLAELRKVLKPGARLAYVVGDQASYLRVMIRTGTLLAEIAESLGYKVMGIDLFRTRLATATREQLREEVVMLKWPGKRK
jgi:DNA modification methylase